MRPSLARETDLREWLSKINGTRSVEKYIEVVEEMKRQMNVSGT